ncbi:hypothetical protein BCR35DRAFT_281011 [Leucosporidium creatinivorum]|uniref:MPN domain-containing protein n=1 Tax=Leucosporidium creatinivorum TaxID=106004 RepID=A0A1Y2EU09_9BASI|nr:hypothetical protein BCR35DRAFT_281011 [Leucosporidium creatinivorum]
MTTYSISPLAYLKVILHAAKYPSSTCVGLLVGTLANNVVTVADAIPLLHHWTELSPMMEAGLQLAEAYTKTQGLVFVGLYVGNELLEDTSIPRAMAKVADALRKEFPQTLVLVLDNQKLATTEPALIPYLASAPTAWKATTLPSKNITLSDPSIAAKALDTVRTGRYAALGDFDEHLEDVTVDWLKNAKVVL